MDNVSRSPPRQDKADRAEATHSRRASRAKAEHSRRGGRAKAGNTLCKNNNCSGEAAAQPPNAAVLLFLQRMLPGLALPPRLEYSALARLARLLRLDLGRAKLASNRSPNQRFCEDVPRGIIGLGFTSGSITTFHRIHQIRCEEA